MEGYSTIAEGYSTKLEGFSTIAEGNSTKLEGNSTKLGGYSGNARLLDRNASLFLPGCDGGNRQGPGILRWQASS